MPVSADDVRLSDFAPQGAAYDGLLHTLETGTFVHAYLISGIAGVGKRTLARCLTQAMMCTGERKPCGVCHGCIQVREGNHPDVISVAPGRVVNSDKPSGKSIIPVDDIREVVRICGEHTYEGGCRVVQIERADKMNPNAQNALLKTLEEPIAGTIFLLMTDSPSLLLPTIISRCRQLQLHGWTDDYIGQVLTAHGVGPERRKQALRVCGGSIGQALAVASDEAYWERRAEVMRDFFAIQSRSEIVRVSNAWREKKDRSDELLNDVEDMLRTMLLVRLGRMGKDAVADLPQEWQRAAQKAELASFVQLLDSVSEARRLRANQVTWQAVVDRLLLRLMEEKSRWSM